MIDKIKIKIAPARMVSKLSCTDSQGIPAGTIYALYNFIESRDVDRYKIGEKSFDGGIIHLVSPKTIYMDISTFDDIVGICNNSSVFDVKNRYMTYDYKKVFKEVNEYINNNLNKFSYHEVYVYPTCIGRDPMYNYYHDYMND